jgi:hypothetical protein
MSAEDDGKRPDFIFEPGLQPAAAGALSPAKSQKKKVPKSYKLQIDDARKRVNKIVYRKRFKKITDQNAQQAAQQAVRDREDEEYYGGIQRDVLARAADAEARVEREAAERAAERAANAARAAPPLRPADDVVDAHAFMNEMERGERLDRAPERAPPGFLERAALEPEREKIEAAVRDRFRAATDMVLDKLLDDYERNSELAQRHGQGDGTAHVCVIC